MPFSDGTADFRSDTVTKPTPGMRRAMADAEVGDDVYSEDPTVRTLEEESAAALGLEAGLFVPSGTMGNQLGIMLQTRPGEEVLCDAVAHLRSVERGAASALSGVAFRSVTTDGGAITPDQVDAAMDAADDFFPRISLMTWENTHGASGGRIVPCEVMEETSSVARQRGLAIHFDGARIWNAVFATGEPAERFASTADTVTFCFSKGLGAPIGSIFCGSGAAVHEARYLRKRLGGGMRQVGVIAAAARVAFAERARLVDDHALAEHLAVAIADRYPAAVDPAAVDTNIVNVIAAELGRPIEGMIDELAQQGIAVSQPRHGILRLVTHRDVDRSDVDRLLATIDG